MKPARITDRMALDALFPVLDDDISTVEHDEETAAEIAEIDRLIDEVDRELAAERHTETFRIARDFTDQRRARRAHRRNDRMTLRSLPERLDVSALLDEEAA
jgi:hypothetical protein